MAFRPVMIVAISVCLLGSVAAFRKNANQYNCFTKEMWTPEKRAWCCENKKLGCSGALLEDSNDQVKQTELAMIQEQSELARIDGAKLSQILTTSIGILTTMVSAFTDDPPDFEYAFDSLNLQGWKLVKLFVPEEDHRSPDFKKAQRAWRAAFEDLGEVTEGLVDAAKRKDIKAIVEGVLRIVSTALRTTAEAIPADRDLILAIDDLVQAMASSTLKFVADNGWFPESFLQLQAQSGALVSSGMDGQKLTQLLTTGVGIVTTFVSAFTEVPPDFEYAFDAMNLQGWKIVKLLVSEDSQKSDDFKKAKKAWTRVFMDATDIAEEIVRSTKGDISAIVNAVLKTVDTALKTAGEVVPDDVKKILDGVGDLILGVGDAWLTFSRQVGWLP